MHAKSRHLAKMGDSPLILIVEDTASLRATLSAILEHEGYRVETASNGREGLQKAQELSPDLILSDLEMPEANGFDLLSGIRADAKLGMAPFVMITGVTDRASTRRAMELGADDYLTKPFSPEEVATVVASRLEKQRHWRQASKVLASTHSQNLMGILPHEFRTPLNSILGFSELMLMFAERGLSPQQTREFAETIQRSGKKLRSHTTRFLALMEYQGLESLPATDHLLRIDEAWAQACISQLLQDQIPQQSVEVQFDLAAGHTACPADLAQNMISELVSNALKFAQGESKVLLRGGPDHGAYKIIIENRGLRFPVEKLAHIGAFVQFEREQHEQQGLGIGLAIVTQAARLSHSSFSIENLAGSVVRATLKLPQT